MAKTNKPLDLIEATKAQAAARHKARYDELVALMRRRMTDIVERFYDLGEALREMLETRRYTAGGHTSLRAFLAAEGLVSYAKANRLIAIVRKVPRAQALVLGQERAFALVAYTDATPEGDSPAALLAADAKLGATPVAQASVRQIEAATRAARSARAKSGAVSEGARAKARADAATLRAVKRALRDAGLAGAAVQVGRNRVTITVDRARADRLART
jgi:hypothetical protein